MGKNDFLSPKAIGNRIKAKGLQKLRWYCQMCNKQCRDENGFKCHQMSDSHRRQMEVFGQNHGRFISGFSEEFEQTFMDHLKRAHPFSRVLAKGVYNEFIADKHHIHMNATRWLTLTEFITYLSKEGKVKAEETEKGWYITLIQEDPMKKLDDEKRLKRSTHEREEEERHTIAMQEQYKRAKLQAQEDEAAPVGDELKRDKQDGPMVLTLSAPAREPEAAAGHAVALGAAGKPPRAPGPSRPLAVFGGDDDDDGAGSSKTAASGKGPKLSKAEELMRQELQHKAGSQRVDHWLVPGIIVKVVSKKLKEHGYYNQKGTVEQVLDKYIGEVCMLDSGDIIRVDQAELETVLPSLGGTVLIVNGALRGSRATLLEINTTRFQAHVRLQRGGQPSAADIWLDYEDICKVHSS